MAARKTLDQRRRALPPEVQSRMMDLPPHLQLDVLRMYESRTPRPTRRRRTGTQLAGPSAQPTVPTPLPSIDMERNRMRAWLGDLLYKSFGVEGLAALHRAFGGATTLPSEKEALEP